MSMDDLGYIADPSQSFPTVLATVHTQEKKQILQRKIGYYGPRQRYGFTAPPQAIGLKREREKWPYNAPLKVHPYAAIITHKNIVLRVKRSLVLWGRSVNGRPITYRGESSFGPRHLTFGHQDIQIAERPEREVAVSRGGEDGPFNGNCVDAMRGEQIQDPQQFSGQKEVALSIGMEIAL
jgi:hypothetical protein